MSILCPECATEVPEDLDYCPHCGAAKRPPERARGRIGGLPVRMVGALAYFVLPTILFLSVQPYKSDRFARFHSWQGLGWFAAAIASAAVLWLAGGVLGLIPVLALLFLSALVGFAFLIAWLILVAKALQGETWKLPVVGDIAGKQASSG